MIQCFNPTCQAVATGLTSRCHVCETPLLYRFLLAVGPDVARAKPGSLIAGRYQVLSDQIWLDIQPYGSVPTLDQIPPFLLPYLRLSELAQHMPRPYVYLASDESGMSNPVLLLDAAPLGVTVDDRDQIKPYLLPSLADWWSQGTALQQLHWLRQVAALWTPLSQEQVAATLLDLDQLRVDQAGLRLTTLTADGDHPKAATLAQLGQQWQPLVPTAQPPVRAYLDWVTQALTQGAISAGTELAAELDQAIQTLGQGLKLAIDWVAYTDQGPARDRNEDACYPDAQVQQQVIAGTSGPHALPLLLVCDGIGGHEQGKVASDMAIRRLKEELQPLGEQPNLSPDVVSQRFKQALASVNDAIVSRNNQEQRSARARMGTTVVAALVHFPYVSIAHLGDSRAYRISPKTCTQITLDDDVASREAHLGYALYSEAVHMPGGGALIQALGISDSGYLYPTVQHLLIDDPSVLLLCSDGLCDYDRVDALWRHTVQPLTRGHGPIQSVAQTLIHEANRLNGHDNVTVGLMRFIPQVAPLTPLPGARLRAAGASRTANSPIAVTAQPTSVPTAIGATTNASPKRLPWATLGVVSLAALLTAGSAAWFYHQRQLAPAALQPVTRSWPLASLAGDELPANAMAITADVVVGSFWQIGSGLAPADASNPLRLTTAVNRADMDDGRVVATGSIVNVTSRQTTADGSRWVRLQVCSIPSGASLDQVPTESGLPPAGDPSPDAPDLEQQLASPGQQGWARVSHLYRTASALESVTLSQGEACRF